METHSPMALPPSRPRRTARGCAAASLLLALAAACAEAPAPPPRPDAVAAPGLYQLPADAVPDGTLRATIRRDAGPAQGVLLTNGERIPVVLQGLGVASPAPARVEVTGQAYGLGRTSDVFGTYRDVGAGGAALDLGGGLQLGNENLVVLRLRPVREGPILTAPGGITAAPLTAPGGITAAPAR